MVKATRPIDLPLINEPEWPAHDSLRAAKGIIISALVGTLFWVIVGTAIWRLFFA